MTTEHNEQQGYTAADMADQGARQFEAGYAAAKAEWAAAAPKAVACSSLCATEERCAITDDGKCDALRAECVRLRSALEAIVLVPPGTVMTTYQMRQIAKKAIAG